MAGRRTCPARRKPLLPAYRVYQSDNGAAIGVVCNAWRGNGARCIPRWFNKNNQKMPRYAEDFRMKRPSVGGSCSFQTIPKSTSIRPVWTHLPNLAARASCGGRDPQSVSNFGWSDALRRGGTQRGFHG